MTLKYSALNLSADLNDLNLKVFDVTVVLKLFKQ